MNLSMRLGDHPLHYIRQVQVKAPLFADSVKVTSAKATAAEQIRRYYAQSQKNPLDPQHVRDILLRRAGNRS